MIDTATLMIAIAFSSGALMLALVLSWVNARRDSYLISWAAGMGFVVLALTIMGLRNGQFESWMQIVPFTSLITGVALIHVGASQFRTGQAYMLPKLLLWATAVLGTVIPLALGLSGAGVFMLNVSCAIYMLLSGYQYWAGRAEAPVPLLSGALLFVLMAASFLACAAMLVLDQQWVLTAPPHNWAEDLNSIMAIIGLTGIGALSLTLNQMRATRRHRLEAQTDALTGLLNRRALFDRFGADLPLGTAVLMFDIDHFKAINDREGHAAGDAVIRRLAGILRQNLREGDAVARIGGEEFCAVLELIPVDRAQAIAERIRADFESTATATVSVGVATAGQDEGFSSTLSRADAALYRAKGGGRNRVTAAPLRLIA